MLGQKAYTYPDGTQSVYRPKDGQVFTEFDSNGNTQSTWQWDDYKEQWFNISSGKPTPQNTATFAPGPFTYKTGGPIEPIKVLNSECECGARHTQAPNLHLTFCPLYTQH